MILIEENKLIHADSCDDVIQHFGIKGMKWGNRKAVAYAKSYGRALMNKYRHPILSTKAGLKTMSKGKLIDTHRRLDYTNKFIADRIAAKKKYKLDKKMVNEKYSKLEDKIGMMKGSPDKIAKMENRNSKKHLSELKKLKTQYKKDKRSSGGRY